MSKVGHGPGPQGQITLSRKKKRKVVARPVLVEPLKSQIKDCLK